MSLIVIIEDNTDNARLAAKVLRKAGHEVLLAADGESGLTTVFAISPRLVLVDLGLPDIDGQTVVGLIRQQPGLEKTLIIAFTAWPEDRAEEMALAYGCDGVITKPMDTRTFPDTIDRYLQQSREH